MTDRIHQRDDGQTFPNILWICTDQQRGDTIHTLGDFGVATPRLDQLCGEGVAFTQAYCQNPICTPSRASFLTGLYPSANHVNRNGNAAFPERMSEHLVTRRLAEEAGYRCGLIGKLHIASAFAGEEKRTRDGYTDWRYSHGPCQENAEHNQYQQWLRANGADLDDVFVRNDRGVHASYRADADPDLHQTTWCAEQAIDLIREYGEGGAPWLLSVNIFDPHPPFDGPEACCEGIDAEALKSPKWTPAEQAWQERLVEAGVWMQGPPHDTSDSGGIRRRYAGMVSLIDQQVGRILDALEATGQREDTVVIFMSDHGELAGDRGMTGKGCRFYDELTRVPLIVSCPGRFDAGRRVDDLVELVDLKPTLLDLAGLDHGWTHGRSLHGYLDPEAAPPTQRKTVRCEYLDTMNMAMPDHPGRHTPVFGVMIRDERYKLSHYPGIDLGELYDMCDDPDEMHNLYDDPALDDIRARLERQLFDNLITQGDPGPDRVARY